MRGLLGAIALLVFVLTFTAKSQAQSQSSSPAFQTGSEDAVEEIIETTPDGKTIRRIRKGKVKYREGEARVGEIEEGEIDRISRRQKALVHSVIGFGPYGSADVGERQVLYGLMYGKRWEVSTTGEIALDFLGTFNDKGFLANGGCGFNFLPSTSDFSPLIGALFGFGYAKAGDSGKSGGGFSAQISGGIRMFRLAEAQMELAGSYTAIFSEGTPGVFGAQLRVLF